MQLTRLSDITFTARFDFSSISFFFYNKTPKFRDAVFSGEHLLNASRSCIVISLNEGLYNALSRSFFKSLTEHDHQVFRGSIETAGNFFFLIEGTCKTNTLPLGSLAYFLARRARFTRACRVFTRNLYMTSNSLIKKELFFVTRDSPFSYTEQVERESSSRFSSSYLTALHFKFR